jgi:site-specific DNA-methyltransferase (adenine-specific)
VRNVILSGNALDVLKTIPDNHVDCVMTSPPYWGLRAYKTEPLVWDGDPDCEHDWSVQAPARRQTSPGDIPGPNSIVAANREVSENRPCTPTTFCSKCGAWMGHLGLEPTPTLFIKHLVDIFDEVKRVLKPTGCCFVNIGDTYSASGGAGGDWEKGGRAKEQKWRQGDSGVPRKSLVMVPERFAMEMVNRGWTLRQKIVWHKPAPMPTSADDRFTPSWEPIYFFTKEPDYEFEQQFEPFVSKAVGQPFGGKKRAGGFNPTYSGKPYSNDHLAGRNMRDVWTIGTSRYAEGHYAVYSPEVCRTPILAGCPKWICTKCGQPRRRIVEVRGRIGKSWHDHGDDLGKGAGQDNGTRGKNFLDNYSRAIVGYTRCECGADFVPGIVLDPFMGSGTTAAVAKVLGRDYIGIELSDEYKDLCVKTIREFTPALRAKWKERKLIPREPTSEAIL